MTLRSVQLQKEFISALDKTYLRHAEGQKMETDPSSDADVH